ncbi:MAG TPA: 2'-5' RNA ligase family protein [Gaiellales bacterium]
MALALELGLSTDAELLVRELWQSLERISVPSLATHVPAIRPHVTLTVTDDYEGLRRVRPRLREAVEPVDVELVGPAFFATDPAIMYLSVGPTAALLSVHRAVDAVMENHSIDRWPHYRPAHWMPHCTLSMGVPVDRLGDAVASCLHGGLPTGTRLHEPRLTDSLTGEAAPL